MLSFRPFLANYNMRMGPNSCFCSGLKEKKKVLREGYLVNKCLIGNNYLIIIIIQLFAVFFIAYLRFN